MRLSGGSSPPSGVLFCNRKLSLRGNNSGFTFSLKQEFKKMEHSTTVFS